MKSDSIISHDAESGYKRLSLRLVDDKASTDSHGKSLPGDIIELETRDTVSFHECRCSIASRENLFYFAVKTSLNNLCQRSMGESLSAGK